jgi:dihydroorotate dehydrogenase (NAD+) catalytic subunit
MSQDSAQLYDIRRSLPENQDHQPQLPPIELLPSLLTLEAFGQIYNSRFGAAASPLMMDSERIRTMLERGYDFNTMKSIRSHEHVGNSYPHWVYVDAPGQLSVDRLNDPIQGSFELYPDQEVSTANSFGIASADPAYSIAEFNKANELVKPGQLLILSIMPSTLRSPTMEADIEALANIVKMTSAKFVELNLACPNTGGHGLIYQDLELSTKLLKLLLRILPGIKIIVKIGFYPDQSQLKEFIALNQELAGIASTNTYGMPIVDQFGNPIFGSERPKAGVSGATVRDLSLLQAAELVKSRDELGLKGSMLIIGIGGVTKPEDVNRYLNESGVDAVQSAAGAWADPNLAAKYRQLQHAEV